MHVMYAMHVMWICFVFMYVWMDGMYECMYVGYVCMPVCTYDIVCMYVGMVCNVCRYGMYARV